MKSSLLRSASVLAMALGLASCGGGGSDGGDYTVGGTVNGLIYSGLTLTNGSDTISVTPNADGSAVRYSFPTGLDYGDIYHVKIGNQPLHQSCLVQTPGLDNVQGNEGRDSAGRLTEINVVVGCAVQTHLVVVSIPKPLAGLLLTNGSRGGTVAVSGTETPVVPATYVQRTFTVPYGSSYGITILEQPAVGGPCTVENGVGTMGDENITNVFVRCP